MSLCVFGGLGFTFVDGGEALPDPVAAAAELDPHPAVSGDQDVGDLVSAEPPCQQKTQKNCQNHNT